VAGQIFDTSTSADLEAAIAARLTKAGLKAESVTSVRMIEAAPIVVAVAPDPAAVVAHMTDPAYWEALLGQYSNYEGYYLEIRDLSGRPFVVSTAAHRAGTSSSWVRSDLRDSDQLPEAPVPTGTDGG
jgi:hypothetical protein